MNKWVDGWMALSHHTCPATMHLGKFIESYSMPDFLLGTCDPSKLTKICFLMERAYILAR
jgi:hypothetical protein